MTPTRQRRRTTTKLARCHCTTTHAGIPAGRQQSATARLARRCSRRGDVSARLWMPSGGAAQHSPTTRHGRKQGTHECARRRALARRAPRPYSCDKWRGHSPLLVQRRRAAAATIGSGDERQQLRSAATTGSGSGERVAAASPFSTMYTHQPPPGRFAGDDMFAMNDRAMSR